MSPAMKEIHKLQLLGHWPSMSDLIRDYGPLLFFRDYHPWLKTAYGKDTKRPDSLADMSDEEFLRDCLDSRYESYARATVNYLRNQTVGLA